MISREDISNSALLFLSFSLIDQKYDVQHDPTCHSGVPWYSEVYTISEDSILDFIDKLNEYLRINNKIPETSVGKKISEYNELTEIHLVRVDDSSFAVFDRYMRPVMSIEGIDMEFKKKEGF